jgi:hydroxymethylpyrimidine pyrophosphatase-like HAD family hydrolase
VNTEVKAAEQRWWARRVETMRRPRLVASDVDGTLLDPTDQISPRTRAAVHRVLAAGVPFVLATGRPPRWIPPVVEQLGHAGPAVCANGAVLYDAATDQVHYTVTLNPEQLRAAAAVVATVLPDAKLAVELPTDSAAVNGAEQFLAEPGYTNPWPVADTANAPRDVLLGQPVIKLLVLQPEASSDLMAAVVRELLGAPREPHPQGHSEDQPRGQLGNPLTVTFSAGFGLIEVSAPGVTKGTGLARLAGELGIAPAEVLAVGDMPNDLPMLRWAGYGVAMANAHPAVLEAADEITRSNSEDGLAVVLERWF